MTRAGCALAASSVCVSAPTRTGNFLPIQGELLFRQSRLLAPTTLSHELMVHCLHTQLLEGNLDAPSTIRLTMRIQLRTFIGGALVLCLGAFAIIARPAPVDDDLMAQRRVFPGIGPGLRAVKKGADGKYYVLASPNVGVAVFDPAGKLLTVIGAAPADASAASKAAPLHPAITFG